MPHDRVRRRATFVVLLILVTALSAVMSIVMAMHDDVATAIVYAVLTVAFPLYCGWTYRRFLAGRRASTRFAARPSQGIAFRCLAANMALLAMIHVHDFDHMRQAMGWGYRFTMPVLLVNFVVCVPILVSLALSARSALRGAAATMVSGPLIGLSFLTVHVFGGWPRVWGPWNDSFIALGADPLSWGILVATVAVGTAVGLLGAVGLGACLADGRAEPAASGPARGTLVVVSED